MAKVEAVARRFMDEENCQCTQEELAKPRQEKATSSSNVPGKCTRSSICENGIVTTIEDKDSSTATIGTQTETDTYGAIMEKVNVLQASTQQISVQVLEMFSIITSVNAMKTSIDYMMSKIDDLSEKVNSLNEERSFRVTRASLCALPVSCRPIEMTVGDHTLETKSSKTDDHKEVLHEVTVNPQEVMTAPKDVTDGPNAAINLKASFSKSEVATAIPLVHCDSKPINPACASNASVKLLPLLPPKNPEELNKRLLPPLKKVIHQKVKYSEKEAKQNMKIMMDTVKGILDAMKATNPLFKDLFQQTGYTGSYYDGLRISEANEFDLNLIIRLPFPPDEVELEASTEPAFVRYRLKRELELIFGTHEKWTKELYQQFKPLFDDERYLLRDKWQSWCQKVITVAWDKFENPEGVSKVTRHPNQCGPAITLKIALLSPSKSIDVDLVPVLDGAQYQMPAGLEKSERLKKLGNEDPAWYLVPKPLKGDKFTQYEVKRCWRISFPEAEKGLLDSLGAVKPLIKLFKLLRDVERWPIASYFIKSIFLLELDERSDLESWQEKYMGTRFLEMMEKFQAAMKVPFIPYYFNRKANLLSGVDKLVADPISNRLGRLRSKLSTNPENIITIFKIDVDK